jgi:hypothetical protein
MKKIDYFPLRGGLDKSSAPLTIEAGRLLDCVNIEIGKNGNGYRFPEGFERYDGQTAPSEESYTLIDFEAGSTAIVTGNTVDGSGSGASGVAIIDAVLESGTYAGSDAAGYIVLTTVSGTFLDTDDLEVAAAKVGEIAASGVHSQGTGAPGEATEQTWLALCAAIARANITAVPGLANSDIEGIHTYGGKRYAFRTNAGDTATDMYVEGATGWTLCNLGENIAFTTGGATAPAEGATLTQGGVTAVIRRVIFTSGSWAANTAAGRFTLTGRAGGNFAAGAATIGAINVTITAIQTANALTKGGRFECINHNFSGHAGSTKMYAVNGKNRAFEYNGYAISFITTGMTTDAPTHIRAHQNHLLLAFSGGSLQNSSLVDLFTMPFVWTAVSGANEEAVGDEITGIEQVQGEALAIFCESHTKIMFGSSAADWNIQDHTDAGGAEEWTIQSFNEPIFMDRGQLTALSASDVYGGFSAGSISKQIEKFIADRAGLAVASVMAPLKSQYRIFFSDGYYVTLSMAADGIIGYTIGELPTVPTCAHFDPISGRVFFGTADGYVYEMDKGTSADGEAITRFMRLPFNFLGSPKRWKKFFKVTFELDAETADDIQFNFRPDFDYMNSNIPSATTSEVLIESPPPLIWDVGEWDLYSWGGDSDDLGQPESYIDGGPATEMSLVVFLSSATQKSFTMHGIILEYDELGDKR